MKRISMIGLILITLLGAKELPANKGLLEGNLTNGLKYSIMHNEKPKNKVELRLLIGVGSLEEKDNQKGLAHFVEHMAFNGSEHFQKNDLIKYLESVGMSFGGDLNAETGYEKTIYKLSVPIHGNNLEKTFTIMEDWANGLSFDAEEFDKERGVILEELRARNNLQKRIYTTVKRVFFGESRFYYRDPAGKIEIIKHADVKRAKEFYHKWYQPEFMHVIVVGDIDPKEIEELIKKHFSKIKNTQHPTRANRAIPEDTQTKLVTVTDKELSKNSINIDYFAQRKGIRNTSDVREQAIRVLAYLLFNMRAREEVLKPKSKLLNISYSNYDITSHKTNYSFTADFKEQNRDDAFIELYSMMLSFKKYGFSQDNFEVAKKTAYAMNENSYKEISNRTSKMIIDNIIKTIETGSIFIDFEYDYNLTKNALNSISLEDVNKFYKNLLDIKDIGIVFMATNNEKVTMKKLFELSQKATENIKNPIENERYSKELLSQKLTPTKIVSKSVDTKNNIYHYRLDNGITVDFKSSQLEKNHIRILGYKLGGFSVASDKDLDNTKRAADWVVRSSPAKYTMNNLLKMLSGKRVDYDMKSTRFDDEIIANSGNKDIETLFQLLYLQLTEPKIDPRISQMGKKVMLAQIEKSQRDPQYKFEKEFTKFYFKNNPRLRYDSKESIEKLDPSKMLKIFTEKFTDSNDFHYIIVGDSSSDIIEKMISTYLGNLPNRGARGRYGKLDYAYLKGNQVFTKRYNTENIANITLSYQSKIPFSLKNRAALDAVARILSIRLRELIREKKSGVYAISLNTDISQELDGRTNATIYYSCDPKRVDELINSIKKAMDSFIKNGINGSELADTKKELALKFQDALSNNLFWMDIMMRSHKFNTKITEYLDYGNILKNLTAEDIQSIAKKIFGADMVQAELLPISK